MINQNFDREFLIFCVSRLLVSGDLIHQEADHSWHLTEGIAGVQTSQDFQSLEDCARAIVQSLSRQYRVKPKAA